MVLEIMLNLEREDIYAALCLSWLKYTPNNEHDIKNIKHPAQILEEKYTKFLEKSKKNYLKIRKKRTPHTQLPKKITSGSSVNEASRTKNQETLEPSTNFERIPKRVRIASSTLTNLPKNPSGSIVNRTLEASRSKNQETRYASRNFDTIPKRVRIEPSTLTNLPKRVRILPKFSSGSSLYGASRNFDPIPKRVLMNLPKNPEIPEASRNSNSIPKRVGYSSSTLTNLQKKPSGSTPKFPQIENLQTLIGKCSNPFEKQLTRSDVDEHQGRLLLNNEDVKRELFPLLNDDCEDVANGIEVKTFDPMGQSYNMRFKTWGNYKSYVLVGSWRKFIKEHNLKENDCVTIWMFRNNGNNELCFALTWRKEVQEEDIEVEE